MPILGCFWCFNCYFSSKPFLWHSVLYMIRYRMIWGLILCLEHSISIISQRLWITVTRWDNFDSYTWTLVLCEEVNKKYRLSIYFLCNLFLMATICFIDASNLCWNNKYFYKWPFIVSWFRQKTDTVKSKRIRKIC